MKRRSWIKLSIIVVRSRSLANGHTSLGFHQTHPPARR